LRVVAEPSNEPVLSYAPGSAERAALRREIQRQIAEPALIEARVAGKVVADLPLSSVFAPHCLELELGKYAVCGEPAVDAAVHAALQARWAWAQRSQSERSAIFLRAAELAAGPFRQRLNAATLLGQSKTPHQAEIDAACELTDFLRFNAHFAEQLTPHALSSPGTDRNSWDLRPLEGFVYAVTPFNFTAIAGNLPSAPALLGNVVIWKPSPLAMLSAGVITELFVAAGLPEGVIQMLAGDAAQITARVLSHPEFAGLHFTGSSAVFETLSQNIASQLNRYRNYPRVVAETGGKDFIVAHPSAELSALAVAIVRGGFEYQGQKCSAASRVYVPRSLWPALEARLVDLIQQLKVGDPADFSCFMGAVISRDAFTRLSSALARAGADTSCRRVCGGRSDDSRGYFVEPTLIEVSRAQHWLFELELFGPVVALFVYDDDYFDDVLSICDRTSPYALTGAIFARDEAALALASGRLRDAAGNFYINDKPTGAVVGQQPFGGARHSGTNDKAGSSLNLLRWVSPRVIKRNLNPPQDFRYPYLTIDPMEEPLASTPPTGIFG